MEALPIYGRVAQPVHQAVLLRHPGQIIYRIILPEHYPNQPGIEELLLQVVAAIYRKL